MASPSRRTQRCDPDVIDTLRKAKGLSAHDLARRAGVDRRTVERMMSGRSSFVSYIARVAQCLGVEPDHLFAKDSALESRPSTSRSPMAGFRLNVEASGIVFSPSQAALIGSVASRVLQDLDEAGVEVDSTRSVAELSDPSREYVCFLIECTLPRHDLAMLIAFVRPHRVVEFRQALERKQVAWDNFHDFGYCWPMQDDARPIWDQVTQPEVPVERLRRVKWYDLISWPDSHQYTRRAYLCERTRMIRWLDDVSRAQ